MFQDLLDDYFTDEKVTDSECSCGGTNRWRGLKLSNLPNEIIFTLLRYTTNRFNRTVKVTKPVSINNIINMGNYSEPTTDVLYMLKGIIMHHGATPLGGHYTAVLFENGTPIKVDDESTYLYSGGEILSNAYIARYEKLPAERRFPPLLKNVLYNIRNTEGLKSQMQSALNSNLTSIRKLEILKLLPHLENTVERVWKLLQEGLPQLDDNESPSRFTELILSYLFGQDENNFKLRFGISSLKTSQCGNCDFENVTEHHNVILNEQCIKMMQSTEKSECSSCGEITANKMQVLTNVGPTIFINKSNDNIQGVLESFHVYRQIEYRCITSKGSNPLSIADVDHFFDQDILIETESEENTFQLNHDCISISLPETTRELVSNLNETITANKLILEKEDISRYMNGYLSDKNIDAFFQTVTTDSDTTCHFMPAGWYASKLGATDLNTMDRNLKLFDKDLVFVPVNTNGHWILIALQPKLKSILYLDPLGMPVQKTIVYRLLDFIFYHHVVENIALLRHEWKVIDLMKGGMFQQQDDCMSCGAMICVYGKMLAHRSPVLERNVSARSIRMFVLHEVVKEYFKCNGSQICLRTILLTEDLADIVRNIMTGGQDINCNERHTSFIRNPYKAYAANKLGFGRDYVSENEYNAICDHLERQFFRKSKSGKSIFQNTTISTVFKDAVALNQTLTENYIYSHWYVQCVLIKNVLVEVLSRHLNKTRTFINNSCIATERSVM